MLLGLVVVVAAVGVPVGIYALKEDAPPQTQLSGYAYPALPLTGAKVQVYEMDGGGQTGKLLTTAVTESDGYFEASFQPVYAFRPLLLVTAGGAYADSATGLSRSAAPGEALKTVVATGDDYASITPLTTWATARATWLAGAGSPLEDAVEAAFATTARQFNLETVNERDAAVIDDAEQILIAGRTSRQLGLILAGLENEAGALGVTPMELTTAVADDLRDGVLDGMSGSASILVDGEVPLPGDATTARLQAAIDRVAASPANKTHLPAPQIALEAPHLDLNTAGSLYVSSTVLPAWIEGRAASATIGASGGKPPYTCELAAGALPKGFSLSSGCAVSGGGTAVLGKNTMLISAPFSVRLSDSAQPPHSVSVELRITVVGKPPVIAVSGGRCPQAGKPCSVTVATSTGGTPPYYYKSGSFAAGAPPMGMTVSGKGVLSGTPTRAGSYTFSVCVVDLVGATDCASTTVTVGEATPPPDDDLPSGFPADLPAGTYRVSVCTEVPDAGFSSCVDGGIYEVTQGDAQALAEGLAQAADQIRAACDCSVRYTVFNGTEFDLMITDAASGSVTRLRVTRIP